MMYFFCVVPDAFSCLGLQGKVVDFDVDYCLKGLKAAHATRRIAELTVAADTANQELQLYERAYNEAKQDLAELEEAKNDRKFDVFTHESALWVGLRCLMLPRRRVFEPSGVPNVCTMLGVFVVTGFTSPPLCL